jgi:hypothetical protein
MVRAFARAGDGMARESLGISAAIACTPEASVVAGLAEVLGELHKGMATAVTHAAVLAAEAVEVAQPLVLAYARHACGSQCC